MSSLEMLTLLEACAGTAGLAGPAEPQPSPALGFRFARRLRWLGVFGQRSLLLVALLSVWEAAPRLGLIDPMFLPPFSEVIAAGWQLAQTGELYDDVSASLLRALSGFLISVVLIVPLGLAVGWYARLGNLLNQFIEICRNTAPLALLPVFILLLGIGELSKITMVVYSCAWPLLLNTIAAVKQVDPLLIKSARTMGATPQQLFRKVILPASLPDHLCRYPSGQRLGHAGAGRFRNGRRQGRSRLSHHQQPVQLPDPADVFRHPGHHRDRPRLQRHPRGAGTALHALEGAGD